MIPIKEIEITVAAGMTPLQHLKLVCDSQRVPSVRPQEAAALLGVHVTTIYRMLARGTLDYVVLGGKKRVTMSSIEQFIETT